MQSFATALAATLFAAVLLTGCAKDATADLEKIATEACECKSADCARAALKRLTTLLASKPQGDEDRMAEAMKKFSSCAGRAGLPMGEFLDTINDLPE